ncbi:hypothetical protein D3C74_221370 [compost metagenome]
MVYKLLEVYKKELSIRNLVFKYFNWKKILPLIIFFVTFLTVSIILALIKNQPLYLSINILSIITFFGLLKEVESQREKILKEFHNGLSLAGIRMKRLKKFLKEESIDHPKEKLDLLVTFVDKQAEELKTPFLIGKGVMAALLIPIWIQGIAWILNKQISTFEGFVFFIIILVLFLLIFWSILFFWKSIVHDEIINSDYNRLKMILNDLRELQFKE